MGVDRPDLEVLQGGDVQPNQHSDDQQQRAPANELPVDVLHGFLPVIFLVAVT